MKCPQGMTYASGSESCTGSPAEFQYCDTNDNSCNGGVGDGILDGNGNSEAWDTCNDLVYAGKEDWRVPTIEELASLVLCTDGPLGSRNFCGLVNSSNPNIDTSLFPDFRSNWFWTSGSYVDDSNNASLVNFGLGYTGYHTKSGTLSVLCVR